MASIANMGKKIPDGQKRKELVETYLTKILNFVDKNSIEYISPFFTEQFFLNSSDRLAIVQALKNGARTLAFHIYKNFVAIH